MTTVRVYTGAVALSAQQRQELIIALPEAIQRRLCRRREPERDTSLMAYTALLRLATQQGITETLDFAPTGKPFFSGQSGCSLSHTAGAFAVGVADGPLGLDIQAVGPCRERVARHFYTSAEQEKLAALPDVERGRLFTRLWVKKEAALKRSGRGLGGLSKVTEDKICTLFETDAWILAVSAEETANITCRHVSTLF